jgi:hypothetical protein
MNLKVRFKREPLQSKKLREFNSLSLLERGSGEKTTQTPLN